MIWSFTKSVPNILSSDQRKFHEECCTDILEMIEADSEFLSNVATCDEGWAFTYDSDSKRENAQWKHGTSQRPKMAKMSRSQQKAMVIPFFKGHSRRMGFLRLNNQQGTLANRVARFELFNFFRVAIKSCQSMKNLTMQN